MAKVAILLADDFEDSEFTVPYERLRQAGHDARIFGDETGRRLTGKRGQAQVAVEAPTARFDPAEWDALVIPGGYSPDRLRLDEHAVKGVHGMVADGKPVAAICHAGSLLVEADVVDGRTVTSWPSVRKDLENAGAKWVDREVVEDDNLVTSRKPDDLDAFCEAVLRRL
jgi:protease I